MLKRHFFWTSTNKNVAAFVQLGAEENMQTTWGNKVGWRCKNCTNQHLKHNIHIKSSLILSSIKSFLFLLSALGIPTKEKALSKGIVRFKGSGREGGSSKWIEAVLQWQSIISEATNFHQILSNMHHDFHWKKRICDFAILALLHWDHH